MSICVNSTTLGDVVKFDGINYKIIEKRIAKGKKKKALVLKLYLLALIMIFVLLPLFAILFFSLTNTLKENIVYIESIKQLIFIYIISFVIIIVLTFFHELSHGLTYYIFGKVKKKNVKFGLNLRLGAVYCYSLVPNSVKVTRLCLMMPIYLTIIPLLFVSLITSNFGLGVFVTVFLSGSAGDLWYMWTLRKDKRNLYVIESLPENYENEMGYYLLQRLNE